ncbi:hypothetical protein LX97_01641 [Nonlabens dokdonensis]|jgi:hypothetical protein|uniref:Secreted protein n=2 Tax=Nonlabens dokdonensis TaxID=328515 RepID=L7WBT0_NONDD|nr:hypothetical protein [Nonlabens dokdonensis]AGC77341.1 hypothetical protein DDD_2214 [Nonlabens dokdonensis DSW-6]PZX40868.1 hypothetical protein LX97_01641 [Nonlabens dokdonensis]
MKKLLFIVALLAGTFSFAQQEISKAQQDLSKKKMEKVNAFNADLEREVSSIVAITKLDKKNHGELREIVGSKESSLSKLDKEGKDAVDYNGRRNDIMDNYKKRLEKLLGTEKFNLLQSKVNPK